MGCDRHGADVLTSFANLLLALVSGLPSPDAFPACPPAIDHCAAVRLWIAPHTDPTFDDRAFLETQLAQANHHHQRAALAFQNVEVRTLGPDLAHVTTRADRDALGHARAKRGVIDVFLVSSLADVDAPGEAVEIRGVHWRSRRDRQRRWIILSRISPPHVLAHELGHYFGLAHSDVPASLMNTSATALAERAFQPDELERIAARARRLLRQGAITDPRIRR